MIGNPLQGGLLGMGGLGGLAPQPSGLLGQYYDPADVRKATIKNMLMLGGLGLMGGGWEGAAKGATAAAISTPNQFRDMAMDAFQMDQAAQDQAWQDEQRGRQRDEWGREDAAYAAMPEDVRKYYDIGGADLAGKYVQATDPAFQTAQAHEFGLQPVPLWDQQGAFAGYGQMSKSGGIYVNGQNITQMGLTPYSPRDKASETAIGRVTGTGRADAAVTYESMISKMPGLETVVSELDRLAEKATYTTAGQIGDIFRKETGMDPSEGAVARSTYVSKVANQVLPLLRDTFGAQFTQVEGERLLATMGDPNMTPPEKQAVLKSFIEQKRRDVEALGVQSGRLPPGANAAGDPLAEARAAIAKGADPEAVKRRLIENGIDPSGL